ncbi:hypothetical protein V6N11_050183 [Hibiscus sabdariffa]|uniref:Uncharacterized protein n=1 Tax=Hibiscus sabdariffa TaxID=183260 RepID=A0ABR2T9A3_9ROSI
MSKGGREDRRKRPEAHAHKVYLECKFQPIEVLSKLKDYITATKVAKGATQEQCKAISTKSGKVLEPPNLNKQGDTADAHSKSSVVIDNPAKVDIPVEADEDHTNPTETKKVETTVEASQPKQIRTEELEEIRPPPPFLQRLKKTKTRLPVQEVL